MEAIESDGVAGRLSARALAMGADRNAAVVICLDLYGLNGQHAQVLVGQVSQVAGVAMEAVTVFCSRNRHAPVTCAVVGHARPDETYLDTVVSAAVEAAREAVGSLRPASVGFGRAALPHLVWNHRLLTRNYKAVTAWLGVPPNEVLRPEGPTDPDLSVLLVRDERGRPMAALWSMAADPRFPDADRRISPGMAGRVQAEIDRRTRAHVPMLFIPGCGGNTSFSRSREETTLALADSLMAVQLEIPCDTQVPLACAAEKVVLALRDCDQFWSEPDVEMKLPGRVELFRREVEALRTEGLHGLASEVKALRIGDHALVALPGVPFAELALEVKRGSPAADTLVAANQGAEVGYVLTRTAFDHEGYEAWPSRSARAGRGAGEFLAEQASELLGRLFPDTPPRRPPFPEILDG